MSLHVKVAGAWQEIGGGAVPRSVASGGQSVRTYTEPDGSKWLIHEFTAAGTFTVVESVGPFKRWIVAGGGYGGPLVGNYAGGGGAGGLIHDEVTLAPGNHAIPAPGAAANSAGSTGSDTVYDGKTAKGGGGGGGYGSDAGKNGGSGGGGRWNGTQPGGTGVAGQGYAGAPGYQSSGDKGGGGGGATGPGVLGAGGPGAMVGGVEWAAGGDGDNTGATPAANQYGSGGRGGAKGIGGVIAFAYQIG